MLDFEAIRGRAARHAEAANLANRLIDPQPEAPPVSQLAALAGVAQPLRPYRLSAAEADVARRAPWGGATIARFTARMTLLMRRGVSATDADDLAERLHLRDIEADERTLCLECEHYRVGLCGNDRRAGLHVPIVGRDMAVTLRRCPDFDKTVLG